MTNDAYPRCTLKLRARGLVYPRTCAECGLGPCKTIASAPHPAHDATQRNLTQGEQRALHKALLASGKVLYRFSAPDATYVERLLEAAREMQASVSAPDATDWKARCEAAEIRAENRYAAWCAEMHNALTAAQAENEKLREALGFYATYIVTGERARITLASLSPPPLSPEKP